MIQVTKAYLPEKKKYQGYIDKIYESGWLTNNGSLLQELESRLEKFLGVKNLILVANGSLALQLAYKALNLKGEVITTPFSFAATTNTLAWEGLKPVFADIQSDSFNIDPVTVEPLINRNTSAIVPVHVFGNPCQVEEIQAIAENRNLKVIYDAAHAFGTDYTDKNAQNQSILNYGDISTISFHATKLFHTIEGGAIVTNDDDLARKVRLLINFGITGPLTIESLGTNAKMNEFEAAMGLCVLDEIEIIKAERKRIWEIYKDNLSNIVEFQKWNYRSCNNYSYVPVLFKDEAQLLKVEAKLKENDIIPRRYFYPSLDTLDYLNLNYKCQKKSKSQNISSRILCLPIYPGLSIRDQDNIIYLIREVLNESV